MGWKNGSAVAGVLVLAMFAASIALGVSYGGHLGQQNTTIIDQLSNITGTYGGESPGVVTAAGKVVSAWYGHHENGQCCPSKSQAKPDQSNVLKLYVEWEVSDGSDQGVATWTRNVVAKTSLTNKEASMQIAELNDPSCTEGPPTWNCTSTIDLSAPASGTAGGSGSQGGSATASYAYSSMPNENTWTKNAQNGGPTYADQDSGNVTVSSGGGWVVDPDNPETHRFNVSATAKVAFQATAKEIVVTSCMQKALAKLEVINP